MRNQNLIKSYKFNIPNKDVLLGKLKKYFSDDDTRSKLGIILGKSSVLTRNDFLETSELKELIREAKRLLSEYNPNGSYQPALTWFNYQVKGEQTLSHSHFRDSSIDNVVAVLYIKAPEGSGNILFYTDTEDHYELEIEEDSFVVFPADVYHMTKVSTADEPRIIMGFDFNLTTKE